MRIGIPREVLAGETRVALSPSHIPLLIRDKHEILVEAGAGIPACFSDAQYEDAGATLIHGSEALYERAEVIFKVQPPGLHPLTGRHEAEMLREGSVYLGFLAPLTHPDIIALMARRKITAFSMEFVPRITRAQSMDALSSMATLAGYRAVMLAATHSGKVFPLLMTAAGTIAPANVLVLGAGVAGLQAIATAHRLGAKVEAFDPRPAVREQVKSLGANFIEMNMAADAETSGGYAKELPAEFLKREMETIAAHLPRVDIVISTAQIFGKRAPLLISTEMVEMMRPGAVIMDLAAEQGGNCELTVPGEVVQHKGVTIVGTLNLAAAMPADASQLYGRNVLNLFRLAVSGPDGSINFEDEVVKGACIVREGEIVNEAVKAAALEGVSL